MKSRIFGTLGICVVVLGLLSPYGVFAASSKPTCVLTVTTISGVTRVRTEGDVVIKSGEQIKVEWESVNAKKATGIDGVPISVTGSATSAPTTTVLYSYEFTNGNKEVECRVYINVVRATIASSSLVPTSSKPVLKGTATGTKAVTVTIFKQGSEKASYTSHTLAVKKGVWTAKISKKLSDGLYTVVVKSKANSAFGAIATGTLAIGKSAQTSLKSDTTVVVNPVPLLVGGSIHSGKTVSISYLQIINIGTKPASIDGFFVKQNGSASTDALVSLSAVDETGVGMGTVSSVSFKKEVILIPVHSVLAPRETRLFTLKTTLGGTVAQYLGTTLMLDVLGVDSKSTIKGTFPIRGTTWTIAN